MKETTLPRKVTFIRHPHTVRNPNLSEEEKNFTVGPDELGTRQARHLGQTYLRRMPNPPDFILASDYLRASEGAHLAVAEAWPHLIDKIILDPRLREQDKGPLDSEDYYDDDNLLDRPYTGGETLRQAGDRIESVLRDPQYADKEIVIVTHSRDMLEMRSRLGRRGYVSLRDRGLRNHVDGIFIPNCQVEAYERTVDPVTGALSSWFTQMEVEETWGDNPKKSGTIYIARNFT